MPLLMILSLCAFVSAFSIRMIDPLVPAIARDFAIPPETAAMLASAYTFPYALSQPVLGPLGDALGKARVIKTCLAILALALGLGALATRFEGLFLARVLAGIGGGGVIPIAFALIGDRFPPEQRQVALSRLVMASQISILLGTAVGGIVADLHGWRWQFVAPAVGAVIVLGIALTWLKPRHGEVRQPVSLVKAFADYRSVFASPFAVVALTSVFIEGIAMSGLTPFIAVRLEALNMGSLREGGYILAAMSAGGVLFTLLVGQLLGLLGRAGLVRAGGAVTAASLTAFAVAPSWPLQAAALGVVGVGFFMIHNSLQAIGTELAPNARASGVAMFAFIFFVGQAAGPIVYRVAFGALGWVWPIVLAAGGLGLLAIWLARRIDEVVAATRRPARDNASE
jgi:predicted MFS family arabinose efflux permease